MSIEFVIGTLLGLIGALPVFLDWRNKIRKVDMSELMTRLVDKNLDQRQRKKVLCAINWKLRREGKHLSDDYIDSFILGKRAKEAVFEDMCLQNRLEPTPEICRQFLTYDSAAIRERYLLHLADERTVAGGGTPAADKAPVPATNNDTDRKAEEMTARIRKASEAGKREVEEMQKHPLTEEEEQRAIETAQETVRLSRELSLLTDRDTDTVYLSAWLAKDHPKEYAAIAAALDRHGVRHDLLPHTADYWCRDYMPVQSRLDRFVGYVYRPDYLDNARDRRYITDPAPVCRSLGIAPEPLPLVFDGGNIVKCPETVIMTEKVFAENPRHTPAQITAMLEKAFQAEILYLPWDPAEPYGHADGVVRHIRLNRVLFTNYRDFDPAIADEMLRRLSARFRVIELRYDVPEHHPDSWAYINYLQTSRVILLPALGIPEDAQALEQILRLFPDYSGRVEQIPLASLVRQGGALNCLTWNIRTAPFES